MTSEKHFDALKAMRSDWMTVDALVFELGSAVTCVRRFLARGMAHGFIVSRKAKKSEGRNGPAATEYTLAKVWGGLG
jgi:predicted transcriptional regulator